MDRVRNIAVVGNYLPRICGIATFTTDLVTALDSCSKDVGCWTVAMNDRLDGYRYPPRVRFEINQNVVDEYRLAREYLNINQVDIVCVQHEYGIFGGDAGNYLLQLLRGLRMPVVTTLHTVLKEPNADQKRVLHEIASLSSRIVVMAQRAAEFLVSIYGVPPEKVCLIHHGIPDMPFVDPSFYKDQFGVEGRKVVLTFGLLSRNKGIEYMIEALPAVVERHPDVVYVVLGATHPHVKKAQGEEYRQGLERLVRKRGVERNVMFLNRFVEPKELCEFLGAADVYVTPYLGETQIVSGTLAYAMGVGKATVSTPYWHAQEMLDDNRGVLCDFRDPGSLSRAVNELLEDDIQRNAMRKRAYTFSRNAVWSQVAVDYLALFNEVKAERANAPRGWSALRTLDREKASLPEIKLKHLLAMTDDTGIVQHATYSVPDRAHGYCIDDNARALIAVVSARDLLPDAGILEDLQKRYLAFIDHAYNPKTGWFRNFMSYDRQWLEESGSEDSQGRTLWALGVCCALSKEEGCVALATKLFFKAIAVVKEFHHPRALSLSLVGIHAYLARFSGDSSAKRAREVLANKLFENFAGRDDPDWPWFDDRVTYANAKVPQALLLSGQWLQRHEMLCKGYQILDWLIGIQTQEGCFSPIGNNGWCCRGGPVVRFDQQPIEAQAMVETSLLASKMSGESRYLDMAHRSFSWFLGHNDLGQPLYDYATGGCRDGLTPDGPNLNQGAESTLAWLLSLISMHGYEAEQKRLQYADSIEP